jgi:hypothetical protein
MSFTNLQKNKISEGKNELSKYLNTMNFPEFRRLILLHKLVLDESVNFYRVRWNFNVDRIYICSYGLVLP